MADEEIETDEEYENKANIREECDQLDRFVCIALHGLLVHGGRKSEIPAEAYKIAENMLKERTERHKVIRKKAKK